MARVRSLWRRARPTLLLGILFCISAVGIREYCIHPSYDFPSPRAFSGTRWYNPYAEYRGVKLRACFHMHSTEALGGSWSSSSTRDRIHAAYRALGTQVIGISEYQKIRPEVPEDRDGVYVTVYEHGFGFGKQHQTVIGSARVNWHDYWFGQTLSQKQDVLDRLCEPGVLVIVNHPDKWQGYPVEDFDRLTGMHGIEIESRFANGHLHWDRALSAGRPLWGFCSDDAHRLDRPWNVGSGWVEIDAREMTQGGVLEALFAGRFQSIWAKSRGAPNALRSLQVVSTPEGERLDLALVRPAQYIHAIGQGGEIFRIAGGVSEMSIPLGPEVTYVRFAAKTDNTFLYLNPVFRSDADDPFAAALAATVAPGRTLLRRIIGGIWALAVLALGVALRRERRRAREALERGTAGSAHPEAEHDVPAVLAEHLDGAVGANPLEVRRERDPDPAR